MALEEKSEDHQSYYSSPWDEHERQYKIATHPIVVDSSLKTKNDSDSWPQYNPAVLLTHSNICVFKTLSNLLGEI